MQKKLEDKKTIIKNKITTLYDSVLTGKERKDTSNVSHAKYSAVLQVGFIKIVLPTFCVKLKLLQLLQCSKIYFKLIILCLIRIMLTLVNVCGQLVLTERRVVTVELYYSFKNVPDQ